MFRQKCNQDLYSISANAQNITLYLEMGVAVHNTAHFNVRQIKATEIVTLTSIQS